MNNYALLSNIYRYIQLHNKKLKVNMWNYKQPELSIWVDSVGVIFGIIRIEQNAGVIGANLNKMCWIEYSALKMLNIAISCT